MRYLFRAVSKSGGLVRTHVLKSVHRHEYPRSLREAFDFIREWNEYDPFWEYTLVESSAPTQTKFVMFEESVGER